MTFLEALEIVYRDPTKMAVPVEFPDGAIIYTPDEHPCWAWHHGIPARIPAPRLLFAEWEVVERA